MLGTDNVQGQISDIFSPQMATIVFIILQIFFATRSFENWRIFQFRPIARKQKDLMDYNDGYLPSRAAAR